MKRKRKRYSREFKISVIHELESGLSPGELSRRHGIHPSLPSRWRKEYYKDPENAFSGNGNTYKQEAKIAELERMIGQLHAENEFLKKAIANLGKKMDEEKKLAKRRRDI